MKRGLELEPLEPRVLLTTLVGGDIFEFQHPDDPDTQIRVKVTGDAIVELFTGDVDSSNELVLAEMPGRWVASEIGRAGETALGGIGGAAGLQPVTPSLTHITDADWPPYSIDAVDDNITIEGLASRGAEGGGETYGLNRADLGEGVVIHLVQMDAPDANDDGGTSGEAFVEAVLQSATLREDSVDLSDTIGTVDAFTMDPTQIGTAYALNADGELFRINTISGAVTSIGQVRDEAGQALNDVGAMAIGPAGNLFLLTDQYDGDATTTHLLQVDKFTANVRPDGVQEVRDAGNNPLAASFTGMAFDDDEVLAVAHDGADSVLYRLGVPLSGTLATVEQTYGGLQLEGLTWAENINNQSVLIALDHSDGGGARMVELDNQGGVSFLNEPGRIADVNALGSAQLSPDGRPVLFATNGLSIIRGSNISLLVDNDGVPLIERLQGADFKPVGTPDGGRMFFTALDDSATHHLYSVDVSKTTRSEVQASLEYVAEIDNVGGEITSLAWDRVGNGAELWVVTDGADLVQLNPATGAIIQTLGVTLGPPGDDEDVEDITGLVFINDDPDAQEDVFYAITGDYFMRIDRTGDAFVFGGLDGREDLQGLTWNTQLRNPFTGDPGVLLTTDVEADELLYLDHRLRVGESGAVPDSSVGHLFALYFSQGSPDSSVVVGKVRPGPPFDMMPFEESIGELFVIPYPDPISAPDETGDVIIGSRTDDLGDNAPPPNIPLYVGSLDDGFAWGTRPAGLDDLPNDPDNNLSAGLRVVESLLTFVNQSDDMGERLMGGNLDNIVAMGVASDGRVAVLDGDNVSVNGGVFDGYELALINANTGNATGPSWILFDLATGERVTGDVAGLDYADIDFDGNEQLYAVLEALDLTPRFSLGQLTPTGLEDFRALAVSGTGNEFYGIAENSQGNFDLYSILRTANGSIGEMERLGVVTDSLGNPIVDIDAIDMDSAGSLYVAGWALESPVPNASLGRTLVPEQILLDSLNDGDGVPSIDPIGPDLRIVRTDGSVFDVNLAGATTLQGVLDAINNAPGNETTATIAFTVDQTTGDFENPFNGDLILIEDGSTSIWFEFDDNGIGNFPGGGGNGTTVQVEIDPDDPLETLANLRDAIEASGLDVTVNAGSGQLLLRHNQIGLPNGEASVQTDATNILFEDFFAVRASLTVDGDAIMFEYRPGGTQVFTVGDLSGAGAELGIAGQDDPNDPNFVPGIFVGDTLNLGSLTALDVTGLVMNPQDDSELTAIVFDGASYDLYELLRTVDGYVDSFSLQGRITDDNGQLVLGLSGIDVDSDGNFHVVGVLPDQLNPDQAMDSDLAGGGLGDLFDNALDLTSDVDSEDLWFLTQDSSGVIVNGRSFTTLLNLATVNDGVIESVDTGTVVGDQFGNDLAILSLSRDGDDLYTVALNATAPLPNANVGGELGEEMGDIFNVRGTAVDQDGTVFSLDYDPNANAYTLVEVERAQSGAVTGTADLGVLEFGGDRLRHIRGMSADVTNPEILYVVGSTDSSSSASMSLYRIELSAGQVNDVVEVSDLPHRVSDGVLRGLAQDPNAPDHFYTAMADGAGGSILMRIDQAADTIEFATGDAATSTISTDAEVDSVAFNGRGDLVAVHGLAGQADRYLLVIDRAASSDFTSSLDDPAVTIQSSEVDSVGLQMRDLAVDPNTGRFFAVNNVSEEVEIVVEDDDGNPVTQTINVLQSQLWVSADELWRFDADVSGAMVVADSLGAITDDGVASLGAATALAIDEAGVVYSLMRTDTTGDTVADSDILYRFDIPVPVDADGDGMLDPLPAQLDARALGQVMYDGTAAEMIGVTFTGDGELIGIDTSAGAGDRVLVSININNAPNSVQLTDPADVTVDPDAIGLTTNRAGRLATISANGVDNADVLISGNEHRLFTFDDSITVNNGEISIGAGVALTGSGGGAFGSGFSALAINADDDIYAIARIDRLDHLVTIASDGEVSVIDGTMISGQATKISAMQFTAGGSLVAYDDSQTSRHLIGIDLDTAVASAAATESVNGDLGGLARDAEGRFYSINTAGIEELWVSGNQLYSLNPLVSTGNPALAQRVATLTADGLAIIETVDALALGRGELFFTVQRGGDSHLVISDLSSGDGVAAGPVRVGGSATLIDGLDFTLADGLTGVDRIGDRLVGVNRNNPQQSWEVTATDTYNTGLVGFSIDSFGVAYAIQTDTDINELWQSPGESMAFGSVDLRGTQALFSAQSFFDPRVVIGVETMAVHPSSGPDGGVYVIGFHAETGERGLFKLDPETEETTFIGTVDRNIKSMDFYVRSNDVRLYGHDDHMGRLVDIDYTNVINGAVQVGQRTETSDGSLRPTVGAIAFDPAQERFLAADNVTGALVLGDESDPIESAVLMEVAGVESESAIPQALDRVFLGGTVMGRVESAGSIDTFYAGWLLTGNTFGQGAEIATDDPNFVVAGDLRNLVVGSSIGTSIDFPDYITGFNLAVGGRVGQIDVTNVFAGQTNIENDPESPGLTLGDSIPREVEGRFLQGDVPGLAGAPFPGDGSNDTEGFLFEDLFLWRSNGDFYNDTFATAQRLGATQEAPLGNPFVATVFGQLHADPDVGDDVDYYAVSLMAGQTVTAQLIHQLPGAPLMRLGVFDPDGRLVYTDYDRNTDNAPFQFTADRPGEYRFAVAWDGDTAFTGDWTSAFTGQSPYVLRVEDVGDIALGGLVVERARLLASFNEADTLRVARGDIGGIFVNGQLFDLGFGRTIVAEEGSVRSFSIGQAANDTATFSGGGTPILHAPQGHVGLLQSRVEPLRMPEVIVGGNVQVIDAAVDLYMNLEAGGGIGIIRADNITNFPGQSYFEISAGGGNTHNVIGLVDVAGDLMGAAFVTNDAGDVRYMRVGGTAWSPLGGTVDEVHDIGGSYTFIDDSGAEIRFHPRLMGDEPVDQTGQPINDHQLISRVYPLIGTTNSSGGQVLIDVVSTGGLNVEIVQGPSGSSDVYLGTLIVEGEGRAVLVDGDEATNIEVDEDSGLVTTPEDFDFEFTQDFDPDAVNTDLVVAVSNRANTNARVNIFGIEGGHFTRINIEAPGELVNLTADSVWELTTWGSLGVPAPVYDAALVAHAGNSTFSVADSYPFRQQTTGIDIAGHAWWISAREAVGNVSVGEDLFGIVANSNGSERVAGQHHGINAPVLVGGHTGRVIIGQGILPTGSGDVGFSGVFVGGELERIHNNGQPAGSDIRGFVNAGLGIYSLRLHDGSLIDTLISAFTDPEMARPLSGGGTVVDNVESTFETPIFFLDNVRVSGKGGIIGTDFVASQIGEIRSDGFGIISSSMLSLGRVDSVVAGGLGIHNSAIFARAWVGDVVATGRGELLDVMDFSSGVRQSEDFTFDPYSGKLLGLGNDLHENMGTSEDDSSIEDTTVGGLLQNFVAVANQRIDKVQGYRIDNWNLGALNVLQAGGPIGTVNTLDSINYLHLTAGRLDRFTPGSDVVTSQLHVAGTMRNFHVRGDFAGASELVLAGPDAGLGNFRIDGNMEGDLRVSGAVNRVMIGGDLIGSIDITAPEETRRNALNMFQLGGTMYGGTFNVEGNVGTVRVDGSLGDPDNPLAAEQLVIDGDLIRLDVGRDRRNPGSGLVMDVVVLGDLRMLSVTGQVIGDILVSGHANSIQINGDSETGLNAAPAPTLAMAGLHDGLNDVFDVRAVTVGANGQIYVLHFNDDSGEHELYAVPRLANGKVDTSGATMELVGALTFTDPDTSVTTPLADIQAMEFNADDGLIYLVGSAAGGNLTLFAFNPAASTAASAVGEVRVNGSALSSTQSIRAISYDDRRDALYAVIHDSAMGVSGADTLVTLNTSGGAAGAATELGRIRVGMIDTSIAGMDIVHDSRDGARLIALDNDLDVVGDGRVIEINLDNPTRSSALSDAGTVSNNVRGYASDDDGNFYAVHFDTTQTNLTTLVQSNYNLLQGLVQVGGDLNRLSVNGGHLDADVFVGHSIGRIDISDGDFVAGNRINVALGDINSIQVRNGDLLGDIRAQEGSINNIMVNGSDFGGAVEASSLNSLRVSGSMLETASLDVANDVNRLDISGDVHEGATLVTGGLNNLNVRGSFAGELESGYYGRMTGISIGENFTGTIISNASDTRFDVRGHFGYDADGDAVGATLLVGRDLNNLRVNGDAVGQISVNGEANGIQFQGDLGNANQDTVVTTGFDLNRFSVRGDMDRVLLQVGVSSGRDLNFATNDTRELSRMADLVRFDAGAVSNSVIAAGGHIQNFRADDGLVDSSLSSGMVVDQDALAGVLDGSLALISETDRNAVRTGVDLYHGSINSVQVNGDGAVGSFITAGVDPIDGDFTSANTLTTTETGGQSRIGMLNLARIDGDSAIVTDAGVDRERINATSGSPTFETVTYDLADIAPDLDPADLVATVAHRQPVTLTVNGETVTIDLTSDGQVDVYMSGSGAIDALVLRGTTDRSQLTIETASETPGVATVNRILAEDDATLRDLLMPNVNLGTTDDASLVDFWIDGDLSTLAFHNMADDDTWTGRIGGDVRDLEMHTQGPGRFVVGGEVRSLTVVDSTGISLLSTISAVPVGSGDLSASVRELAVNQVGWSYVFDEALGLVRVDVADGSILEGPHSVLDGYSDYLLSLNGMDFNDALLLGVAETHSYQPVVNAGSIADGFVSLQSLAVNGATDVDGDGDLDDVLYAIENSGYYLIDAFDVEFDEIVGGAWVADDLFYMVNFNDADTPGDDTDDFFELVRVDRTAEGYLQDVTIVGTIASGGDNLLDVHSMEYDTSAQTLLVAGRTEESNPAQRVYTLDRATAEAEDQGRLQVFSTAERGLFVSPTLRPTNFEQALLSSDSEGVVITDVSINAQTGPGGAVSAGTYENSARVYGITDGVILSTGNVRDYEDGPNEFGANTTAYDEQATAAQQALLQQVTGANFTHYDVTELTISFDFEPGFDTLFFDVVWGSEEFPDFIGTDFIDAFGMFVNGTNVAIANGEPINVNHPDMADIEGTELNGVVAPDGDPLLRFPIDPSLLLPTGNTLTFIIADTGDDAWDSTAYIANLSATEQNPSVELPGKITGMAFRNEPNDPGERTLYGVAEILGAGNDVIGTQLLQMDPSGNGSLVSAGIVGNVEVDGEAMIVRGISFDSEGRLVGQAVDANGEPHRVLIDIDDPTRSVFYSRPGADPQGIESLAGSADGTRALGVANNADGTTSLYGFNAIADRLIQIDPTDGSRTTIGEFSNAFAAQYFNNVEHIAFAPNGTLYAVLNDADGAGNAFTYDDGAALARIDLAPADDNRVMAINPDPLSSNTMPALIDDDPTTSGVTPITDPFGGLAVNAIGQVYAIQKSETLGDLLIEIGTEFQNGKVDRFSVGGAGSGETFVNGEATDIIGMGFDTQGNLLAMNHTADGNEVISLPFGFESVAQAEHDGTLADANETNVEPGRFISTTGTIGDNWGSVNADMDIFRVEADAGDRIVAAVAATGGSQDLRPLLAVYDSSGNRLALGPNPQGQLTSLRIEHTAQSSGEYFVVVAGHSTTTGVLGPVFDPDVVALDASNGGYRLTVGLEAPDPAEFQRTSVPQLLDSTLGGFAVGQQGRDSDTYAYDVGAELGGRLYVSPGAAPALGTHHVPTNLLGSLVGSVDGELVPGAGLGDMYDVRALAVGGSLNDGLRYLAVNYNESAERYELIRIFRDSPNGPVSDVGEPLDIIDPRLPGPNPVQNIHAAAGNHLGEVYIVGTVADNDAQQLFRLDVSTGRAMAVGNLNDGRTVTDPIVALAFDSDTNRLFGIREADDGGQHLLRIDPTTGDATALGRVRVDGADTNMASFDFGADGGLYGIEHTVAGARIVQVDVDTPSASSAETRRGAVNEHLVGYAARPDGTFFSLYNDGEVNTQLWSSNDRDRATVLGRIDPDNGAFTQMLPLLDADDQLLASRLLGITVDEANDRLFSLTSDGRIFEHSAIDGRFVEEYGRVISAAGDGELRLTKIEYHAGTGQLLAVDSRFNQMVEIQLDQAVDVDGDGRNDQVPGNALGENGSINAGEIAAVGYDPDTNDLLGVTRAPEAKFIRFLDSSDTRLGGLYANGFNGVTVDNPGGEFEGRIVATGAGGFNSVRVDGDFTGSLLSAKEIRRFDVVGDFAGTLLAWDDINSINISGNVLAGSTISTSDEIRSFRVNERADVFFAGTLMAQSIGSFDVAGSVLDDAMIDVANEISRLSVSGNFEGEVHAGAINRLDIGGTLGSQALIDVDGDINNVSIREGTARGSILYADGSINSLNINGTHRGTVATRLDINNARFGDIDQALVAAGTNLNAIQLNDLRNSVISSGVWLGADRVYNTADDVIFGGSIARAVNIRGDMISSVIAAGVLPNGESQAAANSPNLANNTRAYLGYNLSRPGMASTFVDDAEAGGLLPSQIGMISVRGNIAASGSATVDGVSVSRASVAVSGDGIDRINAADPSRLQTRIYNDPFGAPFIQNVKVLDGKSFDIIFSEEVNTSSLVLSEDNTGNGRVDGVADLLGTILLTDQDGNVVDDVDLAYRVESDNRGQTWGVLRVIRQEGFGDRQLTIEISGGGGDGTDPAVFDRSGGRSIFRNMTLDPEHTLEAVFGGPGQTSFTTDPFGTILDGDRTGRDGGTAQFINFFGDAPDDFLQARANEPIMTALEDGEDYKTASVGNFFTDINDIDVYQFNANAYDFFSVEYFGNSAATLAVFVRDHQGDPDDLEDFPLDGTAFDFDFDPTDPFFNLGNDTYELVARYERSFGPEGIFQALELPSLEAAEGSDFDRLDINGLLTDEINRRQEHGLEFFIVVAPLPFGFDETENQNYTLKLNMSSTDDMLDGQLDGRADLPPGEQIAYISNRINDGTDPNNTRGNLLGFNDPRQLVYLNFGGGESQQIDLVLDGRVDRVNFTPFDATTLDPTFSGISNVNDLLISGGTYQGQQITSMVDHILTIYRDTPATHPFGTLNVELISSMQDFELFNMPGASGIFFTTINPGQFGMSSDEFTTLHIGEAELRQVPGFLGLAQDVDFANMNKGLDAVVPVQQFAGVSFANGTTEKLNEYSLALSNVIAHELGHVLGLNHSGRLGNPLIGDDLPSNDPSLPNDANTGISTMGSGPTAFFSDIVAERWRFGTAAITLGEFPIGHVDHVDMLLRWLGSQS